MTPTTPPTCPPELEREIFEMAAAEHPEMMPTLVLVAHRVLQWIEPLIYRTLLPHTLSPRVQAALLLAIQRAPAKFTKYVQNLFIISGCHEGCAMLLVSLCNRISRLALFDGKPAMLLPLDNMQVDHLSCYLLQLFGNAAGEIDPRRPLFQALTHLDLWDGSDWVAKLPIAALPALTHLCVHGDHTSSFLLSMLKKCDKLHILVHMYWTQQDLRKRPEAVPDFVDQRLVLIVLDKNIEDWAAGAKGGQDFWTRADKFVAKKRRGEIKPVSRCWIVEEDLID
ncbi:hypothetical protein C8J57DRAFT_1463116 [Mycena rebaudengoi]|nr:hypothetical protein C8J57DRAFT_1463116 [Mycena rebaudengoi]